MPIAQLQAETARALGIYTWATKPSAVGNEGLEIIVSDLQNSRWKVQGAAWRPVSVAKLILDFSGISTTQTTSGVVAGAPTLSLPFYDLMTTPGIIIESCVSNFRSSPQNSQAHSTELRIDRQDGNSQPLASVSATNTSQTTARGTARYSSPTVYQSPSVNQAYSGSTNQGGAATNLFNAGVMYPVKLWANTGGAGETMTFTPGQILIY